MYYTEQGLTMPLEAGENKDHTHLPLNPAASRYERDRAGLSMWPALNGWSW